MVWKRRSGAGTKGCWKWIWKICLAAGLGFLLLTGTGILERKAAGEASQKVVESRGKIALTFDDGPGKYTEELLDGLRERGAKATFFIIGENARSYGNLIGRMKQEGHVVGNHTYSHVELCKLDPEKAQEEIASVNTLIQELTGEEAKYLRPPYGKGNPNLNCIRDMTVVLWNVDPLDWSLRDREQVKSHIITHARDGAIVILHDIYQSSVLAVLDAIDELQQEGYQFVTVEEMTVREEKGLQVIR